MIIDPTHNNRNNSFEDTKRVLRIQNFSQEASHALELSCKSISVTREFQSPEAFQR